MGWGTARFAAHYLPANSSQSGCFVIPTLVRAHLHSLAPLPKEELLAFKRSIAEVAAVGRHLNLIARALNQGLRSAGPGRQMIWIGEIQWMIENGFSHPGKFWGIRIRLDPEEATSGADARE
jgi:hypothetical protein